LEDLSAKETDELFPTTRIKGFASTSTAPVMQNHPAPKVVPNNGQNLQKHMATLGWQSHMD
jgi:hypothetical protein